MSKLIHKKTGKTLAEKIVTASRLPARIKGLLGKTDFPLFHTLWIIPCRGGIHTFFMKFPIDVIFVTHALKITRVLQQITAMKLIYPPLFSNTHSVFEFKASSLKHHQLQPGDQLYVDD